MPFCSWHILIGFLATALLLGCAAKQADKSNDEILLDQAKVDLASPDPAARVRGIRAIIRLRAQHPEVTSLATDALKDPHLDVRKEVFIYFCTWESASALERKQALVVLHEARNKEPDDILKQYADSAIRELERGVN